GARALEQALRLALEVQTRLPAPLGELPRRFAHDALGALERVLHFLREPRLAVRAASGEIARALGEALLAGARFGELLSGASRRALAQAFERRFGPRELLGELLLGPRRSLVVQPIRGTARVLRQSARLLEQTARAAARLHGSGQRQAFEVLRHGAHVLARERGGSARRTGLRAGLREIVEPLPQA